MDYEILIPSDLLPQFLEECDLYGLSLEDLVSKVLARYLQASCNGE